MIERHADFPSQFVAARHVDVWLPPGYVAGGDARYPVLYMHDGQNVFDPAISYGGVDWGVDEAMTRLTEQGQVRAALVVAIWNTAKRVQEYAPQKAFTQALSAEDLAALGAEFGEPLADAYLRFIVSELKPFIDRTYRTLPDRADTFVMGSSMGGLISAYAICEYPGVFGGAGCVSTHWPIGDGVTVAYLARALPDPATHRLYFDYGTATLDAQYEPYQLRADAVMRAAGYVEGQNWITRKFPGAEHSESAWRERVHIPLAFLLGTS